MTEPDDIQPSQPEPGDDDTRLEEPPPAQDESPTTEPPPNADESPTVAPSAEQPDDAPGPPDHVDDLPVTQATEDEPQAETPEDEPDEAVTHPLMEESAVEAEGEPAPSEPAVQPHAARVVQADDVSDTGSIRDEPGGETAAFTGDWQVEMSAHRITIELKRVETRVRELLSDRDSRRKRKLAGTFRWHELEEDIIAWRAERRMAPETLEELHRLVGRRHFLFCQLRFAAGTRPTWNS